MKQTRTVLLCRGIETTEQGVASETGVADVMAVFLLRSHLFDLFLGGGAGLATGVLWLDLDQTSRGNIARRASCQCRSK